MSDKTCNRVYTVASIAIVVLGLAAVLLAPVAKALGF